MNAKHSFTTRFNAAALGLALMMTLATMGGLNQLASSENASSQAAQIELASTGAQPAVQQVVIVGKRATRA